MSFNGYKTVMNDGDMVILQLGKDNMLKLRLKKDESYQTKWGCLRHNDVIGKSFGSKLVCAKGFLHALQPTPELWTVNLPHRTQILYSTDISIVTHELELKPGSIVVESGTGSASLSHAIIRTIAPTGHLHTFEFHEQRANTAKQEFQDHGLSDFVTVTHKDVCSTGFGLQNKADAVFLDLPNPYEAVGHAREALRKEGGRLCSFSPCIEQVQKTCEKLTELGFQELKTVECLIEQFEVRTVNIQVPDMGGLENLHKPKDLPGTLHSENGTAAFKSALSPVQQPGHTGFLTFCTLYNK